MNNERYSYAMAPKQTEWTQTGDPKIGCVQHDCENCKANAERIARLEAENETLQIWGQEAAAEVEALKADLREGDDLRERLAGILTRSVNVIRGEPEPMSLHSWHDLPELVEALKADAERLDWLTEQGQKTTFQWFARDSLVNRGYRLHQGHGVGSATPRAAIDAARSK